MSRSAYTRALLAAFRLVGVLALPTCSEPSGPSGGLAVMAEGPAIVRISESIVVSASIEGSSDFGAGVIRWRVLDPRLIEIETSGGAATVTGLQLGTGRVEAMLRAPDIRSALMDTIEIIVQPGPPAQLVTAPGGHIGYVGVSIDPAPVARIADIAGNLLSIAGTSVRVVLVEGTATLAGTEATTDAGGAATFSGLTVSDTVGVYFFRFTAEELAPAPSGILLRNGPPVTVDFHGGFPAVVVSGEAFEEPVMGRLLDAGGNLSWTSGVPLRLVITGCPTCTVVFDLGTTESNGVVIYYGFRITGPPGNYSVAVHPDDPASTLTPGMPIAFTLLPAGE